MAPFDDIRGICFDLWNTLAHTRHEPNPMTILATAFGILGRPGWRRTIESAIMTRPLTGIGEALDALSAATGTRLPDAQARRELVLAWGDACNANRLYPDTLATLAALRVAHPPAPAYRLGLLSNTQSFDLDFLRSAGLLTMMDSICLSCECGLLKPDPDFFALAADRMGLPAYRILVVGDRLKEDIEGALGAGMRAALLDRTGGTAVPEGVPVIGSLGQLPALLARGLIASS